MIKFKRELLHRLNSIKDWFYDWEDNGICGPGYSSWGTFNYGKLSFVSIIILTIIGIIIYVI